MSQVSNLCMVVANLINLKERAIVKGIKLSIRIDSDMTKVLIALNKAPRNTYVDNKQLAKDTGLSPDDLNDAVELLVNKGLVEWLQGLGTAPFKFECAQLTALGRATIKQKL